MTEAVLVITLISLLLYDLFAVIRGGFPNTISWVIYSNAKIYPVIPFLLGMLAGHFFWSQVC